MTLHDKRIEKRCECGAHTIRCKNKSIGSFLPHKRSFYRNLVNPTKMCAMHKDKYEKQIWGKLGQVK